MGYTATTLQPYRPADACRRSWLRRIGAIEPLVGRTGDAAASPSSSASTRSATTSASAGGRRSSTAQAAARSPMTFTGRRACLDAELRPRPRFKQLVQRTGAAGQRRKRVGKRRHHRLPLVHRPDDAKVRQGGVSDLTRLQAIGDHADDIAAGLEHRVGDDAHQADMAAAVHQRRMRRSAKVAPSARAASRYSGRAPGLEPQKMQRECISVPSAECRVLRAVLGAECWVRC